MVRGPKGTMPLLSSVSSLMAPPRKPQWPSSFQPCPTHRPPVTQTIRTPRRWRAPWMGTQTSRSTRRYVPGQCVALRADIHGSGAAQHCVSPRPAGTLGVEFCPYHCFSPNPPLSPASPPGQSNHNLLRPEAAEAMYLMWKVTGDPQYREWSWTMFRAWYRWARVERWVDAPDGGEGGDGSDGVDGGLPGTRGHVDPATGRRRVLHGGYTSLRDVQMMPPPMYGKMESFWLAETVKYMYLTQVDPPATCLHPACRDAVAAQGRRKEIISLDRMVLNTEAHPLRVVGPGPGNITHTNGTTA